MRRSFLKVVFVLLLIAFGAFIALAAISGGLLAGFLEDDVSEDRVDQTTITDWGIDFELDKNVEFGLDVEQGEEIDWEDEIILSTEYHTSVITDGITDCVSVSEDSVHAIWASFTGSGSGAVYYGRSLDKGETWEDPVALTGSDYSVGGHVIQASGDDVYVVWKELYEESEGILYFIGSHDGGDTWSEPFKISKDGIARSSAPTLVADGDEVYVAWENYEIYSEYNGQEKGNTQMRVSKNGGKTWSETKRVGESNEGCPALTLAVDGSVGLIHCSNNFGESTRNYNWEVMFKNVSEGLKDWEETSIRLTDDEIGDSRFPTAVAEGDNIHVVWWDDRDDTNYEHMGYPPITPESDHNFEIYYKRSVDGGETWSEDLRMTYTGGVSEGPTVKVAEEKVFVVWEDSVDEKDGIYLKYSLDNGETWSENLQVYQGYMASNTSLDVGDNGEIYVIWMAKEDGEKDIYLRKGYLLD